MRLSIQAMLAIPQLALVTEWGQSGKPLPPSVLALKGVNKMIEIAMVFLAIGNIVGLLAAYQSGWNKGYREGRKRSQ